MFLNRWNSPTATDAGGMGPKPLPLSHSSLIPADDDWYANLDGIITRRIPPGFIPLTAYMHDAIAKIW